LIMTSFSFSAVPLKATLLASFAACCLTRRCSYLAFEKKDRHMTTSDMIEEIPQAFNSCFYQEK
jgi:NAD(P)H-hydrate repair Nnr-like enzyme with NAD(P)H-hydrate dehydratase domain